MATLVRLEILLLAADPGARDFLLRLLGRHRVSVVASPAEASLLLRARNYGLVIVTNYGIPATDALAAVPARRDCPVLFLTGHASERIEKQCVEQGIAVLRMPEAVDVLRGQLRSALERSPV